MRDDGALDLDNQFCLALYAASRHVGRAHTEALTALDLTYPQYLAMPVPWEWAREHCVRPTVKTLDERLDLDSGTLTPLLRRLHSRDLIERKRGSSGEREVFLFIRRRAAQAASEAGPTQDDRARPPCACRR